MLFSVVSLLKSLVIQHSTTNRALWILKIRKGVNCQPSFSRLCLNPGTARPQDCLSLCPKSPQVSYSIPSNSTPPPPRLSIHICGLRRFIFTASSEHLNKPSLILSLAVVTYLFLAVIILLTFSRLILIVEMFCLLSNYVVGITDFSFSVSKIYKGFKKSLL